MLSESEVTACIVTRGDVELAPILEQLVFDRVVVWNNRERADWKVAGRYWAALEADTEIVYWQDDDTIVPAATQYALMAAFSDAGAPDIVANWGHGENPDGYDDLPLVCGGAVAWKAAAWDAICRYGSVHPLDESFMYEADFVVGVLYRNWEHIREPFSIRDVAYNGRRLADEPWQRGLKLELTNRARVIRDRERVPA